VPTRRATWLPLGAVVANGLLVDASLDQSIKQLPARHRIGVTVVAADFELQRAVVAGLVPWWLTGWRLRQLFGGWAPPRMAGVALLAASTLVLVHAFARFVVEGLAFPAPIAPNQRLVVSGPYQYVRNPMYLAVVAVIVGQALALGQPGCCSTPRPWAAPRPPSPTATRSQPCAAGSAPSTRPTGGPCPPGGHADTRGNRTSPTNPPASLLATRGDRGHG
jgi:protein-S-isoprenylcysteine O-methyltransferase Ste14